MFCATRFISLRLPLLVAAMLLAVTRCYAIPSKIQISGSVDVQAAGLIFSQNPNTSLTLPAQVKYYGAVNSAITLATITTTAQISPDGIFNIAFDAPLNIVTLDQVWYTVAIDLDQNGLDVGDLFNQRFSLSSVPFALSAKPTSFFVTHGGALSGFLTGCTLDNSLMVSPFVTPPGGVEFTKMSARMGAYSSPANTSFGIYDKDGKLVIGSGVKTLETYSWGIVEAEVTTTTLQPSTLYYAGYTTGNCFNGNGGVAVGRPRLLRSLMMASFGE